MDGVPITLPAFDLRSDLKLPFSSSTEYRTELYHDRQLLIARREVVLIKGTSVLRRLTYGEDIVSACFTQFRSGQDVERTGEDALVVCLKKSAYINYLNGQTYEISFPFTLKRVLPFDCGLLLEKEMNKLMPSLCELNLHQLHAAKFLTLVDPIGEFRIVASSSTSMISPHETLMAFPEKDVTKSSSICVTYNSSEKSVVLYHVRSSVRVNKKSSDLARMPKRKFSVMSTPNPSKVIEDDNFHLDPKHGGISNNLTTTNMHQNSLSVNMEKKRTSTLLSDVSSMARMGSDAGFPETAKSKSSNSSSDHNVFRKDLILTRIDLLQLQLDKLRVNVHLLKYEDQEAVVVLNKVKKEAQIHLFKRTTHTPIYQSNHVVPCEDVFPLKMHDREGFLVVLQNEHSLMLHNPFLEIQSFKIDLRENFPNIRRIMSSCENNVALLSTSGKTYTLKLAIDPSNELVSKCLRCFKYLCGSKLNETIRLVWNAALMLDEDKDEWNAFVITLLSLVFPFDASEYQSINSVTALLPKARYLLEAINLDYSFTDLAPYIILSLHLMREDLRLDILSDKSLKEMGLLLSQMTTWMGWPESWMKYYNADFSQIDKDTRFLLVCILESPPNLFESLASLFRNNIIPYLTFSQLVEEGDIVDMQITPRTSCILKLFELIVSPNYGPSHIIDLMCQYGITTNDLETFPPGIYVLLKEAILICQENPAFEWTSETLDLAGRRDLSMFLNSKKYQNLFASNSSQNTAVSASPVAVKDINHILSNVLDKPESVMAWDGQSEADRISITKLIFDYDRRYYEITTLLHQTKTQTATLVVDKSLSEYDTFILQRELAALVALRTLTIPMGRAALFYAGRMPLLTEKFPIPKFNFSTLIAPTMTNILISKGAINDHANDWGYFHNGVSSGLSISKDSKGISGSWIIFNKPPELNAQHAGFLLGLGLNGHLKKLEEWHIYNYLGPKHPLTSVGLLIGMAASIKGSMDNKLTKVLSVHAVALLPQGANDLNVPIIVQTAGLVGIGLLYLESQHRRMSEILLSQITSSVSQNDVEQIHEGYRLAAGIALGFVNLGKGNDLKGLNDTHVADRLLSLANAMKDYQQVEELDKASCGAVLALGFIYLRTSNTAVANKLLIPDTEQLLDYIRPDILLLRVVAKNLILWDEVSNTVQWVESECPSCLLGKYSLEKFEYYDSDQLVYLNIIGGACFSVAVKYASSHDKKARDTLIYYLDMIMSILDTPATNYDQKVTRKCMNEIQDLIALCVSVIMAGSGDLETFRRLRKMQGDTSKGMGYGNYMAINTALGFLFLGGGQYAFSNSNFAIACLVTSLYPILPSENNENEVHLQALRHFWALSVEPRCLIIRDVNTRKPCKIPITLKFKNGHIKETFAPCLLPNLSQISMISTDSPDHFDVHMDFQLNSEYLEIFKNSLTIFVYKRRNYQLLKSTVGSLLKNENKSLQIEHGEMKIDRDIAKLLNLNIMDGVSDFEKQVFLFEMSGNEDIYDSLATNGLSIFNIIDNKIELELSASNPTNIDQLWNLKLIFAFTDSLLEGQLHFLTIEFIERLKQTVWKLANQKL